MDLDQLRRAARLLSRDQVCAELLALSVVEHSFTPNLSIAVALDGSAGRIADTGRGMRLTPDPGDTMSHAERALTGFYSCRPQHPEYEAVLRELVWGLRGSVGPAPANFACRSLCFTSERDGEVWSQRYRDGAPLGPAVRLGSTGRTGTMIEFETAESIDLAAVAVLVDRLCRRIPGLSIGLLRTDAAPELRA